MILEAKIRLIAAALEPFLESLGLDPKSFDVYGGPAKRNKSGSGWSLALFQKGSKRAEGPIITPKELTKRLDAKLGASKTLVNGWGKPVEVWMISGKGVLLLSESHTEQWWLSLTEFNSYALVEQVADIGESFARFEARSINPKTKTIKMKLVNPQKAPQVQKEYDKLFKMFKLSGWSVDFGLKSHEPRKNEEV